MGTVQDGYGRGRPFQKVDGEGHSEKTFELRCSRDGAAMQKSKEWR